MTVIPQHQTPSSKQNCIDTWKANGAVTVPVKDGRLVRVMIEHWIDCTFIGGKPLDALIWGRKTAKVTSTQFGIIFANRNPHTVYPFPVLWVNRDEMNWLAR